MSVFDPQRRRQQQQQQQQRSAEEEDAAELDMSPFTSPTLAPATPAHGGGDGCSDESESRPWSWAALPATNCAESLASRPSSHYNYHSAQASPLSALSSPGGGGGPNAPPPSSRPTPLAAKLRLDREGFAHSPAMGNLALPPFQRRTPASPYFVAAEQGGSLWPPATAAAAAASSCSSFSSFMTAQAPLPPRAYSAAAECPFFTEPQQPLTFVPGERGRSNSLSLQAPDAAALGSTLQLQAQPGVHTSAIGVFAGGIRRSSMFEISSHQPQPQQLLQPPSDLFAPGGVAAESGLGAAAAAGPKPKHFPLATHLRLDFGDTESQQQTRGPPIYAAFVPASAAAFARGSAAAAAAAAAVVATRSATAANPAVAAPPSARRSAESGRRRLTFPCDSAVAGSRGPATAAAAAAAAALEESPAQFMSAMLQSVIATPTYFARGRDPAASASDSQQATPLNGAVGSAAGSAAAAAADPFSPTASPLRLLFQRSPTISSRSGSGSGGGNRGSRCRTTGGGAGTGTGDSRIRGAKLDRRQLLLHEDSPGLDPRALAPHRARGLAGGADSFPTPLSPEADPEEGARPLDLEAEFDPEGIVHHGAFASHAHADGDRPHPQHQQHTRLRSRRGGVDLDVAPPLAAGLPAEAWGVGARLERLRAGDGHAAGGAVAVADQMQHMWMVTMTTSDMPTDAFD